MTNQHVVIIRIQKASLFFIRNRRIQPNSASLGENVIDFGRGVRRRPSCPGKMRRELVPSRKIISDCVRLPALVDVEITAKNVVVSRRRVGEWLQDGLNLHSLDSIVGLERHVAVDDLDVVICGPVEEELTEAAFCWIRH